MNKIDDKYKEKYSSLSATDEDRETGRCGFVNSNKLAYDFDAIVKDIPYQNGKGTKFQSTDALIVDGNRIVFIEFKDRKITKNQDLKKEVRLKVLESVVAFGEAICNNDFVELMNLDLELYVVYNSEKNTKITQNNRNIRERNKLSDLSDKTLYFDLNRYNKNIFNKIATIDDTLFLKLLAENII